MNQTVEFMEPNTKFGDNKYNLKFAVVVNLLDQR